MSETRARSPSPADEGSNKKPRAEELPADKDEDEDVAVFVCEGGDGFPTVHAVVPVSKIGANCVSLGRLRALKTGKERHAAIYCTEDDSMVELLEEHDVGEHHIFHKQRVVDYFYLPYLGTGGKVSHVDTTAAAAASASAVKPEFDPADEYHLLDDAHCMKGIATRFVTISRYHWAKTRGYTEALLQREVKRLETTGVVDSFAKHKEWCRKKQVEHGSQQLLWEVNPDWWKTYEARR